MTLNLAMIFDKVVFYNFFQYNCSMKLICAPIATVSHAGFRSVVEKFGGCDEYFCEMINAASLVNGGQFEKYYIETAPAPEKIVWQLVGKDAGYLAEAAAMVARLGGIGVDINMGCCAPEIVKAGAGIAWMFRPHDEVRQMLKAVRDSISSITPASRLSVKLRLGDDNFTDEGFFDFCEMLADSGVQLITLHARTKKEKYRTHSRWQYAGQLAERMKNRDVAVYLNGDVCDVLSMRAAIATAPNIDGVMIARAAVQKPWIFLQLKAALTNEITHGEENSACEENSASEKYQVDLRQTALDFIDALEKYQPREFWQSRAKRFFAYYCQNFSFAHYAQTQFTNAHDTADLRSRIDDYFKQVPDDKIKYL